MGSVDTPELQLQRCGHSDQQQGRRRPLRILSIPTAIRRTRVASCLGEVTQQIHSLRASGVMASQNSVADASSASERQGGVGPNVPPLDRF